jgi:hypothetical protein
MLFMVRVLSASRCPLTKDGAQLTLSHFLLEYISLDITRPELCQYPFKLYSATDLEGMEQDEFHDGFVLLMRADEQDMAGGEHHVINAKDGSDTLKKVAPFKFRAWVLGDKEIRVAAPLLSWNDRGNEDQYLKIQNEDEKVIIAAVENGRNGYIKRVGISQYEIKEKIYVLSLVETEDVAIKLDGSVLICNKFKNKTKVTQKGLLKPTVLSVYYDVSRKDAEPETITLGKKQFVAWKITNAPRLAWHIANVAKQARRKGVFKEEVSDDDDEDIAIMLKKKATIGNITLMETDETDAPDSTTSS